MFRKILFIFIILGFANSVSAQNEWLPKGRIFQPNYLDPLEAQAFLSITGYSRDEQFPKADRINVPFGFGFYKAIVRKEKEDGKKWEFGADFMVISQFSWRYETDWNAYQRRLLSTDYKVGGIVSYQPKEDLSFRFRFYHLSAHWGDDFIIYNSINNFEDSIFNYEQIDLTLSKQTGNWTLFGSLGYVLAPKKDFDGATIQLGANWSKEKSETFRWVAGTDIKMMQFYDFRPNAKLAAGIELGKTENKPVKVMLEYYNGYTPYATTTSKTVQWLGGGIYLQPF